MSNPPAVAVLCLLLCALVANRAVGLLSSNESLSAYSAAVHPFLLVAEPIPINRVGVSTLEGIPGVGPVLARRIVNHRAEHGDFTAPSELVRVPGIGPATRDRITPFLSWQPRSHTLVNEPSLPNQCQPICESDNHDLP